MSIYNPYPFKLKLFILGIVFQLKKLKKKPVKKSRLYEKSTFQFLDMNIVVDVIVCGVKPVQILEVLVLALILTVTGDTSGEERALATTHAR